MTPEQESQFNRFGCFTWCLIKMAELAGRPICKQEFCDRFGDRFHDPVNRYGYLDMDRLPEIAAELGLLGASRGSPTKLVEVPGGYESVVIAHNQDSLRVLVKSEVHLDEGVTDLQRHCSLLYAINADGFTLWTNRTDGSEQFMQFLRSAWNEKQCKGMVFV